MEQRQAPIRVQTGALDDGRHHGRQLVIGLAGWALVLCLIVWLSATAGEIELRATLFLVTVAIVLALVATSVAVDLLRPSLIRSRARKPASLVSGDRRDALGREVTLEGLAGLPGEFTIEQEGATRRYVRGAAS